MSTQISSGILGASRSLDGKIPQGGASTPVTTPRQLLSLPISRIITSSDVLAVTDVFSNLHVNKATAISVTIPPTSTGGFTAGEVYTVTRIGAGTVTFILGSGVTAKTSLGALTDAGLNQPMTLIYEGSDVWNIVNGSSLSIASADVVTALGYTPANANVAWTRVELASDVVLTTTSFADITGLSFPITSGVKMEFRSELYIDASNATEGVAVSINGPTIVSTTHMLRSLTASNAEQVRQSTAYNTMAVTASGLTSGGMAVLKGRVSTSVTGTIQFRGLTETGAGATNTIRAGSYVEYRVMNF